MSGSGDPQNEVDDGQIVDLGACWGLLDGDQLEGLQHPENELAQGAQLVFFESGHAHSQHLRLWVEPAKTNEKHAKTAANLIPHYQQLFNIHHRAYLGIL